jgi:protein-L-isoaspartate(D-aspartate) O-methyltransferase
MTGVGSDGVGGMIDFSLARQAMVNGQLRTNDVTDSNLLDAFTLLQREVFVDPAEISISYADRMVTAAGNTNRMMLSPMVLGRMIQAAMIQPSDAVLDIAGGAGYSAAIMSYLGGSVTLLEDQERQGDAARKILQKIGVENVHVGIGPLSEGGKTGVRYDAILINGRCEILPESLFHQLSDGGRLVAIMGFALSSVVRVYTASEGVMGEKRLMSAAGPALSSFSRRFEFVF